MPYDPSDNELKAGRNWLFENQAAPDMSPHGPRHPDLSTGLGKHVTDRHRNPLTPLSGEIPTGHPSEAPIADMTASPVELTAHTSKSAMRAAADNFVEQRDPSDLRKHFTKALEALAELGYTSSNKKYEGGRRTHVFSKERHKIVIVTDAKNTPQEEELLKLEQQIRELQDSKRQADAHAAQRKLEIGAQIEAERLNAEYWAAKTQEDAKHGVTQDAEMTKADAKKEMVSIFSALQKDHGYHVIKINDIITLSLPHSNYEYAFGTADGGGPTPETLAHLRELLAYENEASRTIAIAEAEHRSEIEKQAQPATPEEIAAEEARAKDKQWFEDTLQQLEDTHDYMVHRALPTIHVASPDDSFKRSVKIDANGLAPEDIMVELANQLEWENTKVSDNTQHKQQEVEPLITPHLAAEPEHDIHGAPAEQTAPMDIAHQTAANLPQDQADNAQSAHAADAGVENHEIEGNPMHREPSSAQAASFAPESILTNEQITPTASASLADIIDGIDDCFQSQLQDRRLRMGLSYDDLAKQVTHILLDSNISSEQVTAWHFGEELPDADQFAALSKVLITQNQAISESDKASEHEKFLNAYKLAVEAGINTKESLAFGKLIDAHVQKLPLALRDRDALAKTVSSRFIIALAPEEHTALSEGKLDKVLKAIELGKWAPSPGMVTGIIRALDKLEGLSDEDRADLHAAAASDRAHMIANDNERPARRSRGYASMQQALRREHPTLSEEEQTNAIAEKRRQLRELLKDKDGELPTFGRIRDGIRKNPTYSHKTPDVSRSNSIRLLIGGGAPRKAVELRRLGSLTPQCEDTIMTYIDATSVEPDLSDKREKAAALIQNIRDLADYHGRGRRRGATQINTDGLNLL